MSQKNDGSGLYIYVPMILTAAFLLGCLAISLVEVREGAIELSSHAAVSQSELSPKDLRKKSAVKENGGLKYRMVSRSDADSVQTAAEVTQSVQETANDVSSEPEQTVSSEDTVDSVAESVSTTVETAAPVTEPVSSTEDTKPVLKLPNEHYINFTPPKEGYVAYLTFDDGPSSNTEEILDILDYYNVKATFFVIYHKDMADKYKAIADRGHTIALHTYTHDYSKVYRSEDAFFNEINRIGNYVYSVTGVRSRIIRFPGGSSNTVSNHYCRDIMQTLKVSVPKKGYVYHDWNVDTGDAAANNLATEKILENVKKSLTKYRKPDILMHDSGATKGTTVEALPELIEYIYSQGYKMERLELDSYAVHHDW